MSQPEIITIEDSISVVKDNCTRVNYFIFNEYEIHLNTIPSGAVQEWHFHSKLEESILILTGELLLSWQDHGQIYNQLLKEGTIVRVKDSVHTFSNTSSRDTTFVVFRFIPDGQDKRELIKNDKTIVKII
ncbi:cupin domain-containing protein [Clostridium sp. AN503]|uniref:cupin domain-containing protein n=1 Tax=Clostridium sp. AN503 TaxID=3160598 RepID=UPI003459DFE1